MIGPTPSTRANPCSVAMLMATSIPFAQHIPLTGKLTHKGFPDRANGFAYYRLATRFARGCASSALFRA